MTRYRLLLLALTIASITSGALAQANEQWRAMNQPVEPFRIMANLYYVGASSVTAFLITTDEGHILIDGGFVETAPMILDSIRSLGFEPGDVRYLLNSHGHFDHAGGLAELKRATGATLAVLAEEVPLLERGGLRDDVIGDDGPYPAVSVDRALDDGDSIELGGMSLTAHRTAGHTRGCTSWAFELFEDGESHQAVSICSLSILDDTRLTDPASYPGIAQDYAAAIERLRSLPANVFLASHAGFFQLRQKKMAMAESERNPFIDPEGYHRYLDHAESRLQQRLSH